MEQPQPQGCEQSDPFAAARNTDSLEARKARHRAALSAARPFLVIGLLSCTLGVLLGWLESQGHVVRALSAADVVAICVGGAAIAAGRFRVSRYLHDHPLDRDR
jgi:hypothetical protein